MKIAVNIMAVPERMDMVDELMFQLDGAATVFVDEQHLGVWWNAKQAWSCFTPEDTHVMVLQEDIEVCADFIETVEKIVEQERDKVISLCPLGRTVFNISKKGVHWIELPPWRTFGIANVMPTELADKWLDWCARNRPDKDESLRNSDDGRLGDWLVASKRKLYGVVPTPVQHLHGRSMIGHNHYKRITSKVVIPPDVSGLDYDWADRRIFRVLPNQVGER